jgi:hypothetical protein
MSFASGFRRAYQLREGSMEACMEAAMEGAAFTLTALGGGGKYCRAPLRLRHWRRSSHGQISER